MRYYILFILNGLVIYAVTGYTILNWQEWVLHAWFVGAVAVMINWAKIEWSKKMLDGLDKAEAILQDVKRRQQREKA